MAQDTASAILKDDEALGLREEKKTEDFSEQANALIQRVEQARQAKGLRGAQALGDEILALEKKCRQAQDGTSGSRLCCCYLRCFVKVEDAEKKEIELNPEAELLVDALDPTCLDTLDSQALGCTATFADARGVESFSQEIFVEVERARLILLSALMNEKAGKIEEAAQMLQDVQVETFGAMDRVEKTKYILKQMMLLLQRSDFIRCQIVSKKLNPKLFEASDLQTLKIKFYELMILYYLHEQALLEVARAYGHIFNTPVVQQDRNQMKECLEFFAIFMVLAPYDANAKELIAKTLKEEGKKLQQVPTFEQLLKDLSGVELLSWPLPYDAELREHAAFGDRKYAGGEGRWNLLRKRVIQHNLRVLSENYSVIELQRVASLLGIAEEEAEKELSELASAGVLDAKIDRPARTVAFGKPKTDLAVLDEWSSSLSKLLDKVDLCCHMIQKERMVHAARAKAAAANARIAS
ncbi:26S proteasome non-ATPase regulatory subunit, putative [Eimeria brunetti]|uniref:26S proteasome non-ATPase regulatory subunit, putative n=1 Tax=Eimeria brunetti TaxID=51314 RepID=U6L7V3_9EIME|nr:26S proteasome non-ATPase regulatory subunit, putative [Eimeria brunetti]